MDCVWVAEINEDPLDEKQRGFIQSRRAVEGGGQPHGLCFAGSKLARERGASEWAKGKGWVGLEGRLLAQGSRRQDN